MSTYIVRCLDPERGRGRVRHVSTGEEANFASPEALFDFMERMNAQEGAVRESEESSPVFGGRAGGAAGGLGEPPAADS